MKLLLDEMISFRVAAELRARGHDVEAIKRDRADLESTPDVEIVRQLARERRAIVTNNVKDLMPIHHRFAGMGESHAGMVFTHDSSLPRSKASIPLWAQTLETLLAAHPDDDALKDQVLHLP